MTCCGLSLLLRSDTLWVHPLVAALAMSSKFVLRIHGKHVYNPANLGVDRRDQSPARNVGLAGAMGQRSRAGGVVLVLGSIVTGRARRLDISWVFLGAFLGIVALARAAAWPVVGHLVASARQRRAAVVRVFHDLRSDDDPESARAARIVYALVVALRRCGWQFLLFRPNALIWALFLLTPLVPLLDRLVPGRSALRGGRCAVARPSITGHRSERLFLFVLPVLGVLGSELLLQVRRRRLVVRQRHRPRRVAGGHRLEPRRVAVELGQAARAR